MKKILLVVGARPNFMKVAPVYKEFKKHPIKQRCGFVTRGSTTM